MTLTEFLLARIAEDEALAKLAEAANFDGVWEPGADAVCDEQGGHVGLPPSRVLTECEAKRRIVAGHAGWHVCPNITDEGYTDYGDGSGDEWEAICPTLLLLALPDADHPDYQEEWKP